MNSVIARIKMLAGNDVADEAIAFIRRQLMSSRNVVPSDSVKVYMRTHLTTQKDLAVYRGVSVGNASMTDRRAALQLGVGDDAPKNLVVPRENSAVMHCTLSKSVASYYANGGDISVVMELEVPAKYVIFDYRKFPEIPESVWGDAEDYVDTLHYLQKEREVFVDRDFVPQHAKLLKIKVHGVVTRPRLQG